MILYQLPSSFTVKMFSSYDNALYTNGLTDLQFASKLGIGQTLCYFHGMLFN